MAHGVLGQRPAGRAEFEPFDRPDHRHADELGELDQQFARVGVDDAAAGHDQRPLGGLQVTGSPEGSSSTKGEPDEKKRGLPDAVITASK